LLRDSAPPKTAGDLLSNNPHIIDFMGYDAVCRSEFIREAFFRSRVFADKSAPTGTSKPTSAISPSLLCDSAASGRRGDLLQGAVMCFAFAAGVHLLSEFPSNCHVYLPGGELHLAGFHAPRIEVSLC
jgi:hypothetical protein